MANARVPQSSSWRPTVVGSHYAVACGHPLAATAALNVLSRGGNAIDAGVAMAMALAVLQPDIVSFAGVAPTLIYLSDERKVVSLPGLGKWPKATDVSRLAKEGNGFIPEGILRQVIPAAPATHLRALREFGTISFEEAVAPALSLARDGFAMYPELRDGLEIFGADIDRYPENASVYKPGGKFPILGDRFKQSNLAQVITRMVGAERSSTGDRKSKLQAVHDYFYRGEIAREIDKFHRENDGFMRFDDLAEFEVCPEDPISCMFQESKVYSCDVWCQGIVLLEALKILEPVNLAALGHNSAQYIHTVASALNLAFGDREAYVGDPKFVDVPTTQLLSDSYAARQRARIRSDTAFPGMAQAGSIPGYPLPSMSELLPTQGETPLAPDTTYGCVVDAQGNAYSITPSDNTWDSPMIPGLGLLISSRGSQGRLNRGHPAFVEPGKRPRLTPTPAMALRDGRFQMAWGTPGGDVQCPSMLQVFLNITQFGMTVQQAIEAPRIAPFNFPNSFSPNAYFPARLCLEEQIEEPAIQALSRMGYDIQRWPVRAFFAGSVCAIRRDAKTGLLHAGADPRRPGYALAW